LDARTLESDIEMVLLDDVAEWETRALARHEVPILGSIRLSASRRRVACYFA
jgi:hypothetical protein